MKILCIGDIVGKPGRRAVQDLLPGLREEYKVDCVIANAENCAGGSGVTGRIVRHLFQCGCDVITLGDHVWDQKETEALLPDQDFVLRPANFSRAAPGRGWCVKELPSGEKIGVIAMMGRVFMKYHVDCPFNMFSDVIGTIRAQTSVIVMDMHAEATSEKIAMGYFVDGKISAMFGTHTHVATADEKILPQKTAYITDIGMTGPHDSVIGQKKENILKKYVTGMPVKFDVASGDIWLNGILLDVNSKTGEARTIKRIRKECPPEE